MIWEKTSMSVALISCFCLIKGRVMLFRSITFLRVSVFDVVYLQISPLLLWIGYLNLQKCYYHCFLRNRKKSKISQNQKLITKANLFCLLTMWWWRWGQTWISIHFINFHPFSPDLEKFWSSGCKYYVCLQNK